jgi:hypothetical protein
MKNRVIKTVCEILTFILLFALLLFLMLADIGCCVTAYHHDRYAYVPALNQVVPTDKIEGWQGQLLFPSKYKQANLVFPDGAIFVIADSMRWTDPNILTAAGDAVGTAGGAAIKKLTINN